MGGYYHSLFSRKKPSMILRMTREKIKGKAGKKNYDHKMGAPDFYKEMGIVEDQHSPYYNKNRDFATSGMAKPVPILADFSGWGTAKNPCRTSDGAGRLLDPSWLMEMGEQKLSSSSLKKKNSCCNYSRFLTGNVASVVVKKEHIEDGDEVFFEGKRFYYFAGASVPKTPAVVDFLLASVTARGPIGWYMPKCA